MTCLSCLHSRREPGYPARPLFCALTLRQASKRCERFEYEPGTDEEGAE